MEGDGFVGLNGQFEGGLKFGTLGSWGCLCKVVCWVRWNKVSLETLGNKVRLQSFWNKDIPRSHPNSASPCCNCYSQEHSSKL